MEITENPDNPSTAVALIKNKRIERIYEKPDKNISGYSLYPVYLFGSGIFEYLRKVKKSEQGEYNISDAVNLAIKDGKEFGYLTNNSLRININTPQDVKKAAKLLSCPDLWE